MITDDEDRIIGCHLLESGIEIIVTAGIAVEMVIQSMNLRKIFSRIRQSVRSSTKSLYI